MCVFELDCSAIWATTMFLSEISRNDPDGILKPS